jgi:hypothetical protein
VTEATIAPKIMYKLAKIWNNPLVAVRVVYFALKSSFAGIRAEVDRFVRDKHEYVDLIA